MGLGGKQLLTIAFRGGSLSTKLITGNRNMDQLSVDKIRFDNLPYSGGDGQLLKRWGWGVWNLEALLVWCAKAVKCHQASNGLWVTCKLYDRQFISQCSGCFKKGIVVWKERIWIWQGRAEQIFPVSLLSVRQARLAGGGLGLPNCTAPCHRLENRSKLGNCILTLSLSQVSLSSSSNFVLSNDTPSWMHYCC